MLTPLLKELISQGYVYFETLIYLFLGGGHKLNHTPGVVPLLLFFPPSGFLHCVITQVLEGSYLLSFCLVELRYFFQNLGILFLYFSCYSFIVQTDLRTSLQFRLITY